MPMPTTLSRKYQIVVPKPVRERMGLRAGEEVAIYPFDEERAILVKHPSDSVRALRGLGKELWHSLGGTENYIKQERASWRR